MGEKCTDQEIEAKQESLSKKDTKGKYRKKTQKEGKTEKEVPSKRTRAASVKYYGAITLGVVVLVITIFLFLAFILPVYRKAAEIGKTAGETGGRIVGTAVGSFQGVMKEIPKGWEDGKEQGLSAEDMEIDIINKIDEIGSLEVLAASVRLDDELEIADDYKAIYVYKADAIFSVNLKDVEFQREGDILTIILENPLVDFYINEAATEKVAEWQKHFYSGKTADGYEAYINSRIQVEKKAPEEIKNYDTLMSLAKDSAKKQLGILVEAICGEEVTVKILFAEEGE